jgi:DNA-binding MarR family transcriptional regulator
MTLNQLAKTLGMERSTLPRNLRPLIRRHLVEVMRGPDKRAKVIRLTKAGEKQVARMIPHWERAQARVLKELGIGKWRSLGADLRLLARNVGPAPTRKVRD